MPHCPRAVGSAIPAIHCLTTRGQWAVELLVNAASLPKGIAQSSTRSSCIALLLCLGAMGSATRAFHCLTARG